MSGPTIIKKIVTHLNKAQPEPEPTEEDHPLEYYELREIAKRKVLLKSSVKAHGLIFLFGNIFLYTVNFLYGTVDRFFDVWAFLPFIFWGMLLWVHYIVYLTDNIVDYRRKMFYIDCAIVLAINPIFYFMNVYTNYLMRNVPEFSQPIWWPTLLELSLIAIVIHAYFAFIVVNDKRIEKRIQREMTRLSEEKNLNVKSNKTD